MDDIGQMLSGLQTGGASPDTAQALAGLAEGVRDEGGLDALVGKLRDAGLDVTVSSWIGGGPNQPVDPQALGAALGPGEVQRLSAKSGLDVTALLPLLAAFLPQIINMLTPSGSVPAGGLNKAASEQAPDLGGLLGGLLGGAGGPGAAGGAGLDDLLGGLGGMLGGQDKR